MTPRPHFPIRLAQCVQAFLLKVAPFYKLSVGLGSTDKPSLKTLAMSFLHFPHLRPPFYLTLSGTFGRNCPFSPPFLFGHNGSPAANFFRPKSWPNDVRCSIHLQFHVVSLLLFHVSTLLSTVSFNFFDLQIPSMCAEEFMFPRHARCVMSETGTAFYPALTSPEPRILHAAPAVIRLMALLMSFCTVQLRTLRRSLFGYSFSAYDLRSRFG